MRRIIVILILGCLAVGCDEKPKEATEVPEDLMREIALDAARDAIKIEGTAILMTEAKDQIQQLARQTASATAKQVAADESRMLLDKIQIHKLELRIQELENQVQQLKAARAKEPLSTGPSK